MKAVLMATLIAVGLCGCTNQQAYNAMQTANKNECDKLQTVQRQECLKRLGLPYDKYEEERQKLLKQ